MLVFIQKINFTSTKFHAWLLPFGRLINIAKGAWGLHAGKLQSARRVLSLIVAYSHLGNTLLLAMRISDLDP